METQVQSYSTLQAISIFIFISILATCIFFPDRCIGTHARPDLPGPRGLPVFGNMFHLFLHRKEMLLHLSRMEKKYGELFTFTMLGWGRNIVVNRPEWLDHIRKRDTSVYGKGSAALNIFHEFPGAASPFGTEGLEWRISRKIMQPVFLTKNFDNQVSKAMDKILPIAQGLLSSAASQSVPFDFNNLCGRLALVIFCKMALNLETTILTTDPECLQTPDKMMDAVLVLNRISSGRLYNPFWYITEKFDGEGKAFNAAREDIFHTINEIVRERKVKSLGAVDEQDFLSSLLTDGGAVSNDILLRDTLVTLLFAGRDNTQNVLGWSLYELSRKPEWIEMMREEAQMQACDGLTVRYTDISKFPIHLAVFYETLRLWPGVPKNARLALKDDVLPAIPAYNYPAIKISKGDYVLWSDYSMMRNVKVWGTDANVFNPGRHLSDERKFIKPPQTKFHAFGAGPRLCPGAQLAAYEFVAIWAAILPSFDLIPVHSDDRYPTDALTMAMDGPFFVKAVARP